MAKKTSGMMILLIILIVVGAFYLYSGKQGAGSTLAIAGSGGVCSYQMGFGCNTQSDCVNAIINAGSSQSEITGVEGAGMTLNCVSNQCVLGGAPCK